MKQLNRTALVTGASGGIGQAIALRLAKEGFKVALHYNKNQPAKTIQKISEDNGICQAFRADLTKSGFETNLLNAIKSDLGTPDILINNAAIQDIAPLQTMTRTQFDAMTDTNVGAVFSLSKEFAIRLTPQQAKHAAIINISSIEASRPAPGHAHYAASKAALEMLTKSFAFEYGKTGLRVNAIAPGLIFRQGIEQAWPQGVDSWNKACPLGRMGQPDDIANAVAFLISDAASFINGTVLTIDGGLSATPGW